MKRISSALMNCDCLSRHRFSGYNWHVAGITTIEGFTLPRQMQ